MGQQNATRFVETSVYRLLDSTMKRSLRSGWNALVVGAAGTGKTRAISELNRRHSDITSVQDSSSSFIRISTIEVTGTLGSSLYELLDIINGVGPARGVRSLAALERSMREGRGHWEHIFLIFDEAQNLSLKAARTLLGISEAANLRMMFVGNPEVLKLVSSGQAAIQQISRRLPIRETIDAIVDDDADMLAGPFGCEGPDVLRLVREVGRGFHADGIVKVLQEARVFADLAGAETIGARHVESALAVFPQFRIAVARASGRQGTQPRTARG